MKQILQQKKKKNSYNCTSSASPLNTLQSSAKNISIQAGWSNSRALVLQYYLDWIVHDREIGVLSRPIYVAFIRALLWMLE